MVSQDHVLSGRLSLSENQLALLKDVMFKVFNALTCMVLFHKQKALAYRDIEDFDR
jgi:hypothetical protein